LNFLLLSWCLLQHCLLWSCRHPSYLFQRCLLFSIYCLQCCFFSKFFSSTLTSF
jgi:hypothetical protein